MVFLNTPWNGERGYILKTLEEKLWNLSLWGLGDKAIPWLHFLPKRKQGRRTWVFGPLQQSRVGGHLIHSMYMPLPSYPHPCTQQTSPNRRTLFPADPRGIYTPLLITIPGSHHQSIAINRSNQTYLPLPVWKVGECSGRWQGFQRVACSSGQNLLRHTTFPSFLPSTRFPFSTCPIITGITPVEGPSSKITGWWQLLTAWTGEKNRPAFLSP